MKKVLSVVLVALMVMSLCSLVGCGDEKEVTPSEKLKFGMGVDTYIEKVTSADAETNGKGEYVTTVAAVLLDKDGKIVKTDIDSISLSAEYTSAGSAVAAGEFKTKRELGDNYGMVAYGNAKYEWYEQVDNFEAAIKGKTFNEVKSMMAEDGKGNADIVKAGCTIDVSDFVKALEKAVNNAVDSKAVASSKLNIGIVASQGDKKDATDEADGANEITTTVAAAATDKDGKVIVSRNDEVSVNFAFDNKGASKVDTSAVITTKLEQGENYGMVAYGNAEKEWFEQAAELDKAIVGQTAEAFAPIADVNGYGVVDLKNVGCTIYVGNMVKALVKAATVK